MEKEPDGLNLILHFRLLYVKMMFQQKIEKQKIKGGLREGSVQLW